MKSTQWFIGFVIAAAVVLAGSSRARVRDKLPPYRQGDCPYKVYVILGMHANFYHSWRGDTPDEAGFGQDIRIVREILRMLEEAESQGKQARVYWEGESLFTFENIIPNYAPDILEAIKKRIAEGKDEFMPAPYSNTLFSAVTEDEMRAVVRWALSNPWGSGAKDMFGAYVPLLRPQEAMTTTGQARILKEEGIEGLVLAYSSYSFTAFSNFVPPLPPEQRYHFTWMRMRDEGPRILLFPCVSAADVVNQVSLDKWLLKLRKLQTSGQVNQDLVIHINFDADAESWLPLVPKGLRWIPNSGGLPEIINTVNKFEWAEFTVPSEYLAAHEPTGEVIIRQDTADGGWDGNYSWAEKYPSHLIWTELEKSRLFTKRAEALFPEVSPQTKKKAHKLLYEGRDSSFFHRIRGLSTTHFGMSTPLVNEERQAVAEKVVAAAKARAEEALRLVADEVSKNKSKRLRNEENDLYTMLVRGVVMKETPVGTETLSMVRTPIILPASASCVSLADENGNQLPFALQHREDLGGDYYAAELVAFLPLKAGQEKVLKLVRSEGVLCAERGDPAVSMLRNDFISLELDEGEGIASLKAGDLEFAGPGFLRHFITYGPKKNPKTYENQGWRFLDLSSELASGLSRGGLSAEVAFPTEEGEARAEIEVRFTLPPSARWALADVSVRYPYTPKKDMLHNIQQKLRRLLDLKWVEVAPFELHPRLDGDREHPLKIWKHNWLGVTSWYELNYGQINPKNAELDSFNHQVTAGWVAATDRKKGLLLAQCADVWSVYAFCPMRLREDPGQRQQLYLNPFGSYHGKQMDYSHLGGNGVGSAIGDLTSSALRPNGPSYNGMRERFLLLLAPYRGDEPPPWLQAEAMTFFYPPAVVFLSTPSRVSALLPQDLAKTIMEKKKELARRSTKPLPAPLAFLANPTDRAVHLVWDQPEDLRIQGYEVQWREKGQANWQSMTTAAVRRCEIPDLENGKVYEFRVRTIGSGPPSPWTKVASCKVGPVKPPGIASSVAGLDPMLAAKFLYYIGVHLLTTPP